MIIEFIKDHNVGILKGTVIEVNEKTAKRFIEQGYAIETEKPEVIVKPTKAVEVKVNDCKDCQDSENECKDCAKKKKTPYKLAKEQQTKK